jgi:hypothetical protein
MDYMLGNFPTATALYRTASGDILDMGKEGMFEKYQAYVPGGFKYVKVHAGQKFYLANLEIEVLTTYDDLNPYRIDAQNDTNTVLRFSMYTTNESGQRVGEPVTSLWAGDSNKRQSRHMCAMYGSYLQSDMVQMAHHGNIGCEKDFYTNAEDVDAVTTGDLKWEGFRAEGLFGDSIIIMWTTAADGHQYQISAEDETYAGKIPR